MHNQWYDLFSASRMLYYLAGIVVSTIWHYFRLKRKGITLDLGPIGIIAGVSVMVFLAVQQLGLSDDVEHCQIEFATVLRERATLSDQSDTLSSAEIEANSNWLAKLTNPPPAISVLPRTDPVYRDWAQSVTKDYLAQINKISDDRKKALEARKEKTYPLPTCGA